MVTLANLIYMISFMPFFIFSMLKIIISKFSTNYAIMMPFIPSVTYIKLNKELFEEMRKMNTSSDRTDLTKVKKLG